MKDNYDKNFIIYGIISIIVFMFIFSYIILKEIEDFKIDHQCYMMSDEEFYSNEQCKPYWSYRQVGKK